MSSNEPDVIDDLKQADQVEHVQVDYSHITLLALVLKQINLEGSYLLQSVLKYSVFFESRMELKRFGKV